MVTITAETPSYVRAEAHRAPVQVTYDGQPDLVVLSVADYELLRTNRRLVLERGEMPAEMLERIAGTRMADRHAALDDLMDD
jgi:PHD/YefM family antitoxin component YafN of YafNO toxin-antitoxin module